MSVYALSASDKESCKMMQDPRKNSDRHQNLNRLVRGPRPSLQNFHHNPFIAFWDILRTYTPNTTKKKLPPRRRQKKEQSDKRENCFEKYLPWLFHWRQRTFQTGIFGLGPEYVDTCGDEGETCMSMLSFQVLILMLAKPIPKFLKDIILP